MGVAVRRCSWAAASLTGSPSFAPARSQEFDEICRPYLTKYSAAGGPPPMIQYRRFALDLQRYADQCLTDDDITAAQVRAATAAVGAPVPQCVVTDQPERPRPFVDLVLPLRSAADAVRSAALSPRLPSCGALLLSSATLSSAVIAPRAAASAAWTCCGEAPSRRVSRLVSR